MEAVWYSIGYLYYLCHSTLLEQFERTFSDDIAYNEYALSSFLYHLVVFLETFHRLYLLLDLPL